MNELVVITGYKEMNFNDKDGKEIDMLKLTCLSKNSGADAIGFLPVQQTYMDKRKKEIARCLTIIPGLYEAEYAMVPGKNNKPSLEIVGFTCVKEVDIRSLFEIE